MSAGALNTGMFATWEKGDELRMSESISESYTSIHELTTIFKTWNDTWPPSDAYIVNAFFKDPSLLNTDPAMEFIADQIAPQGAIKRRFVTAAVDANTGEYVNFTNDNCTFEELPHCAMASGSIPVALMPIHFKGYVLMDGGTVWNMNIDATINQCLDMGYESKDIIIDMV